jgi:hypothetical protein
VKSQRKHWAHVHCTSSSSSSILVVWSLWRTQSSTAVRPSLATFQSPGCCLWHTTTTGQGLHLTTPDLQGTGLKNSVPCSEREGVGALWYHHQVIQQTQGPDFQPALAPYLPHSRPGYGTPALPPQTTVQFLPFHRLHLLCIISSADFWQSHLSLSNGYNHSWCVSVCLWDGHVS